MINEIRDDFNKLKKLASSTKCTMCGKQFGIVDVQDGWIYSDHKGYGSKYDGTVIQFNLCADGQVDRLC